MTFLQPTCSQCGRPLAAGSACVECGNRVSESGDARVWLGVGDYLDVALDAAQVRALLESSEAGDISLTLKLEMTDLWESYEGRRVLLARVVGWSAPDGAVLDAGCVGELKDCSLVLEQQPNDVRQCVQHLPDGLRGNVRLALARQARGSTVVSVFRNDAGLALDELVEVLLGQLDLAQIRALFTPLLDAMARVHAAGVLHLRLTPWSVRVREPGSPQGIPLQFLHDVMGPDGGLSSGGLGEEETFSELDDPDLEAFDEDSELDILLDMASDSAANPFLAAGAQDRTRDDITPLPQGEFARAGGGATWDSGAQHPVQPAADGGQAAGEIDDAAGAISWIDVADEDGRPAEIELLFDGVEGFIQRGENLDFVPFFRGFSAPELMGRSIGEHGVACDVFSLGMVLYFLLAGQLAPVSVYTRQTPALPARNLRPDFPPGLQAVISRATRPNPAERYPDVDAFRKAFERACDVMQARMALQDGERPQVFVAVDTHTGIGKRQRNPVNQDAVFTAVSQDRRLSLMLVADGVSTASFGSGDLASSALAVEARETWQSLLDAYVKDEPIEPRAVLQGILNRVNERLVEYVNARYTPFHGAPHEVMGTTVLLALIFDGEVTLATLGDSRVYLSRGEAFEQLSTDHNLWTLSILDGAAADNALAMPHGDALARCLGTFVVRDERLIPLDPEPDYSCFTLISGDTLLLTTDGLVDFAAAHMHVAEDYIHQVLVSEPDPALACLELILLANRGGGGDNIGVGIAKFV